MASDWRKIKIQLAALTAVMANAFLDLLNELDALDSAIAGTRPFFASPTGTSAYANALITLNRGTNRPRPFAEGDSRNCAASGQICPEVGSNNLDSEFHWNFGNLEDPPEQEGSIFQFPISRTT